MHLHSCSKTEQKEVKKDAFS